MNTNHLNQIFNPSIEATMIDTRSTDTDIEALVRDLDLLDGPQCPHQGEADHMVTMLDALIQGMDTMIRTLESINAKMTDSNLRLASISTKIDGTV